MIEEYLLWTAVVLFFAVALGLEWRYRLRSIRLGTVAIVLVGLGFFGQAGVHAAWRVAIGTPPAERVKDWGSFTDAPPKPMSDYESGVSTMERAVGEQILFTLPERWFLMGVLLWLACSPAFRCDSQRRPRTDWYV